MRSFLVLVERTNGPRIADGKRCGWLQLVAPGGTVLWSTWIGVVEPGLWAELDQAVADCRDSSDGGAAP